MRIDKDRLRDQLTKAGLLGNNDLPDDQNDIIDIKYDSIVNETPKAWLIRFPSKEECWLPKSQCNILKENNIIYLPGWLLTKIIVQLNKGN